MNRTAVCMRVSANYRSQRRRIGAADTCITSSSPALPDVAALAHIHTRSLVLLPSRDPSKRGSSASASNIIMGAIFLVTFR
jgi:hypothetical protein